MREVPSVRHLRPLLIALLCIVVYAPSFQNGFVWDDDVFLTESPLIKASDGLRRFWFTTQPPDYFPLTSTSLWLEWRLWGMNATGYHVVNVLLHALSSIIMWFVLRRLRIPGAWLAATIFAVHPVNVESVAWITERKNTLSMALYLLSTFLYLRSETNPSKHWYSLSLFCFLLALLGKTSVVMLPFVLLGCAWWQRGRVGRKDVVRTIPFFALSTLMGLVTRWFQYSRAIGPDIVRSDGFLSRLAGAGWAVWFYSYKAIIPHKLSFVYPRWEINASSPISYLPTSVLIVCFLLLLKYRKSWARPLLFGFGYYVVTLFPVLGFFDIYFMKYSLVADHWQYSSIIGIIALSASGGYLLSDRLHQKMRYAAAMAAVVLTVLFSVLTWRQCRIYRGVETLWLDTIAKNPDCWMAFNNLGLFYQGVDRKQEAIASYRKAIAIKPDYVEAYTNLGVVHADDPTTAISLFRKAIAIRPDYAEAYFNLGNVHGDAGRRKEAIEAYRKAIEIDPHHVKAYGNLGGMYRAMNRREEALALLEAAVAINRNLAEAHRNLGSLYSDMGRMEEAIASYRRAIAIEPDFAIAHNNLAVLYYRDKQYDLAIKHCDRALELEHGVHPEFLKRLEPYR